MKKILEGIEQAKAQKAERYTVKQMERTRKSLETRLAKLNDQSRKDDVVTFEQLGIDRIFIDESHYFKNLFLATKNAQRGRHCPDRSPEIQRSVYEERSIGTS